MKSYMVHDICDRFGVDEHTVLHWLHSGQLKGVVVNRDLGKKRRHWRITPEQLAAFELERTPKVSQPKSTVTPAKKQ